MSFIRRRVSILQNSYLSLNIMIDPQYNNLYILIANLVPMTSQLIKKNTTNLENNDSNIETSNCHHQKQSITNNIILKMKIQKMIKVWLKKSKKSGHRFKILKQWQLTQQAYIRDLKLIVQKIQKPLVQANTITQDQQLTLFPNLQSMIQLSESLLSDIKKIIMQWNPNKTLIGEKFIHFHKFFIIYRDYSNNYMKSLDIIKNLKTHPIFLVIENNLPLDVQSFLIKPIQRPPKYQLLLRQYQKLLAKDHPDNKPLSQAIKKSHEVNEENNQSMQSQIKHKNLVDLEHRYGDIITQNMRFYIGQYDSYCLDVRVKVYLFTDMVLVVRRNFDTLQEEWNKGNSCVHKKVPFDGQSFIEILADCKYIENRLFLCGIKQNLHLSFSTKANRDIFYQMVRQLITNIKENQHQKRNRLLTVESRNKQSMPITITTQSKIIYQPNLRIIVSGVEKRPISSFQNQTYYILKFETLMPDRICQYVYTRWSQLLQIDEYLRAKKESVNFPLLNDQPTQMSYYDVMKNKSKIIEFRTIYIERYMNYVFRSDEAVSKKNTLRKKLGINDYLWKFVTSSSDEKNNCECSQCFALSQAKSLKEVYEIVGLSFGNSRETYSLSNRTSSNYTQMLNNPCVFAAFKLTRKIIQASKQQFRTLEQRMLWIDCNCGRINYTLLKIPQIENPSKVKIYFLNIMNDMDFIEVNINSQTLVYDVMQQIGELMGIRTMKDFGLFLDYKNAPRLLDLDQNIQKVMNQVSSQVEKEVKMTNSSFFDVLTQNLSIFKKWSEDVIVGKKSRLYVKKYLTIEPQLQIEACQNNHERARILVNEIFYRFNHQHLVLTKYDSKQLCGLFYVINKLEDLSETRYENFKMNIVEMLLPKSKHYWLEQSNIFGNQVYNFVEKYQERVNKSVLKTQQLYGRVIKLVANHLGWSSIFFQVTNYNPSSLPGNQSQLLAGVSFKKLVIIKKHQISPLIEIQLDKLEYKITPFSLFIYIQDRSYRFNGHIMYNLKKIIEIYKSYSAKFQNL